MTLLLTGVGKIDAAAPPAGPVGFVGVSTTDIKPGAPSLTHSFSHTRPVTTQGALVVKSQNDTPVSGVTYGGVALTKVREEGFGSVGTSFWMGNNADMPTGSNTVVITFTGTTSNAIANVNNLENVDQTTMWDADGGQNGSLSSSSLNVTIATDGLAMDTIGEDFSSISTTGGASQITLNNSSDGSVEGGSSYNNVQTAGSKILGWTWSFTNDCGHVIVSIKNG